MIKNISRIFLFFSPILFFNAFAGSPDSQLIQILETIKNWTADFEQVLYDDKGNLIHKSKGRVSIAKPNRFRWVQDQQVIVGNGKKIFIYDRDLQQLIIRSIDRAIETTPLAILSGSALALKKGFTIRKVNHRFQLISKNSSTNFLTIDLQFDSKSSLQRMTLADSLDQKTELIFFNIKANGLIKSKDFECIPPKGTDLIQEN